MDSRRWKGVAAEDIPSITLDDLERFYDLIIDRQFWLDDNSALIRNICDTKFWMLHGIYFNPSIMAQLSILDKTEDKNRRQALFRLIYIFHAIVDMHCTEPATLLIGLPTMNPSPPKATRPRQRMPLKVPPPSKNGFMNLGPPVQIKRVTTTQEVQTYCYFLLIGPKQN
jgi:hypothetical protein